MKILAISPVYPYPPHDGDRIRVNSILKRLAEKHTVRVVTFAGIKELTKPVDFKCQKTDVVRIGRFAILLNVTAAFFTGKPMNVAAYDSKDMRAAVNKAVEEFKPDVIYCHRIRTAPYALSYNIPAVIDVVDSLGLYLQRQSKKSAGLLRKIYAALDKNRVLMFERNLGSNFKKIFINYEEDAEFLKPADVISAPNGAEICDMKKAPGKNNGVFTLGFFGDFNYAPNKDGLKILLKKVWQKYYKSDKSIRLIIAGKNSEALCSTGNNIVVKGYISDMQKEIKSWDASIAPVFYGAGRQNKVLLSWACGVPVIASDFAAKGVLGKDGINLLSAASPEGFAKSVEKLRRNKALGPKLAKGGRLTLKRNFSWDKSALIIEREIKNAVRRKK
ncbi:MAG: glycosyltransferase [Candidatus Goldbacteria bacterium]|nr:glycosyltransferase [Candidatus Goldiibacteriota bacterium]